MKGKKINFKLTVEKVEYGKEKEIYYLNIYLAEDMLLTAISINEQQFNRLKENKIQLEQQTRITFEQ